MLDLLERQTTEAEDYRKVVATTNVGDIATNDVQRGQGPAFGVRAAAQDGDERVTFSLAPGHWPRVFPGL